MQLIGNLKRAVDDIYVQAKCKIAFCLWDPGKNKRKKTE